MDRTRGHEVGAGCAWAVGLASLAWLGLGLAGGHGSPMDSPEHHSVAAVLDTTPPEGLTVRAGPNAAGWYRAPADYSWSAEDSESGISWCQIGSVEPTESAAPRTVYGTCANGAGLMASYTGFSYRYDASPPRLDPSVSPTVVPRRGVVVAQPRGVDALSGVERQACNGGRALSTRRLGVHRATCFARDRAGNLATADVEYLVVDRRESQE